MVKFTCTLVSAPAAAAAYLSAFAKDAKTLLQGLTLQTECREAAIAACSTGAGPWKAQLLYENGPLGDWYEEWSWEGEGEDPLKAFNTLAQKAKSEVEARLEELPWGKEFEYWWERTLPLLAT